MSRMTVYPAAGRVVPDPEAGGTLAAEGRDVPRDAYWLRRLRVGDVTTDAPEQDEDVTPDVPAPDQVVTTDAAKKAKAAIKPPASAALGSAE